MSTPEQEPVDRQVLATYTPTLLPEQPMLIHPLHDPYLANNGLCECEVCEEDNIRFEQEIERRMWEQTEEAWRMLQEPEPVMPKRASTPSEKPEEPFYDENHPNACCRCGVVDPTSLDYCKRCHMCASGEYRYYDESHEGSSTYDAAHGNIPDFK